MCPADGVCEGAGASPAASSCRKGCSEQEGIPSYSPQDHHTLPTVLHPGSDWLVIVQTCMHVKGLNWFCVDGAVMVASAGVDQAHGGSTVAHSFSAQLVKQE